MTRLAPRAPAAQGRDEATRLHAAEMAEPMARLARLGASR